MIMARIIKNLDGINSGDYLIERTSWAGNSDKPYVIKRMLGGELCISLDHPGLHSAIQVSKWFDVSLETLENLRGGEILYAERINLRRRY
jgi:hypothetical protein